MIKWLYEILYAISFRKAMKRQRLLVSFRQALRFVRCDLLTQEEIKRRCGIGEDNPERSDR